MSVLREHVRARLVELITSVSPECVAELRDEATLVGDLGLESVQLVELMAKVERAFDIEVNERDARPIETVADLVEAVMARRSCDEPPSEQDGDDAGSATRPRTTR